MNFALLGGDRALLPLLQAIAADAENALRYAALVPDAFAAELLAAAPAVRLEPNWEGLLHAEDVDAVIAVAEQSAEAAVRQLASAGKPVLLQPNGDPASAMPYELALVRDDTGVALLPLFPARHVAEFQALCAAIGAGELGRVFDLQWTRRVPPDGGAGSTAAVKAGQVHAALIHDADVLRQLGGDYDQVTAVYVGDRERGFSRGTVTLAGRGLPTATWAIQPATGVAEFARIQSQPATAAEFARIQNQPHDDAGFELAIATERGRAVIRGHLPAGAIPAGETGISVTGDEAVVSKLQILKTDVPREILAHFAAAIGGDTSSPNWSDMMRAVEIVEAGERSVRRRRTIDLHFETTSERNQFKSQMTAIGCGLLSATLVAVVFLLIVGNLFNLHPLVMQIARIGVFAPLALFLLLQLLLFLSRPSRAPDE